MEALASLRETLRRLDVLDAHTAAERAEEHYATAVPLTDYQEQTFARQRERCRERKAELLAEILSWEPLPRLSNV